MLPTNDSNRFLTYDYITQDGYSKRGKQTAVFNDQHSFTTHMKRNIERQKKLVI